MLNQHIGDPCVGLAGDHIEPGVALHNNGREVVGPRDGTLQVPVTHLVPARLMGSGLGRNTAWRGDYDIQLADPQARRRWRLGSLRFGDMVAIVSGDVRFGPSYRDGRITVGVIVHGDSTVSGHGPGVTALLSGPASRLQPVLAAEANLARILGVRAPLPEAEGRAITRMRAPALAYEVASGIA